MDLTSRLQLKKPNPDPVTGDVVDISKLNENFDTIDAGIGATICTSATHPMSPWDGQFIRETDTRRLYVWNAAQIAWDEVVIARPAFLVDGAIGTVVSATTTEAVARALPSRVYKNDKAYSLEVRCQANSSAVTSIVFKLRKGSTTGGTLIIDYGRSRVSDASVDMYLEWSCIFRNVSGADITTQLAVTVATSAGTCALKGFGSGPFSTIVRELDGSASDYFSHPTIT